MLRKLFARLRDLWILALRERATPRGVGWSVGVGVFVGCTPAIGFHAGIALAAATLFRLNRLWCFLGSRVATFITLPWIVLAEIQVAHRLRTGAWATLLARDALDHAKEWLLDWCIGTVPVGSALGAVVGGVAYGLARRRDVRQSRLAPPRAPSSESPPSGSPDRPT